MNLLSDWTTDLIVVLALACLYLVHRSMRSGLRPLEYMTDKEDWSHD